MLQPTQFFQNMKQIIIVNEALNLPKEKLAVQMARASSGAFSQATKVDRKIWLKAGRPQVVLKALDEKDLQDLLSKAQRRKLPIYWVNNTDISTDDGITCLGIGPASNNQIDQLTNILNFYCWIRQNVLGFGLLES